MVLATSQDEARKRKGASDGATLRQDRDLRGLIRPVSTSGRSGLTRSVQHPRGEPTDECFIALVILIGPFAFVLRWLWRAFRRLAS